MKRVKSADYYVGLDMGDASVGWAVTDMHYNILKFNGKALWGIRLFDSAKTAAEARGYRSARRRIERTTWRLQMLQELFAAEIGKVDPGFFMRLADSRLHVEDKREQTSFNLFVDEHYTDKEFYQQYPTMYHLRYALATQDGPFDVRLLYLAVQHIAKHRGHFLFENLDASKVGDFATVFAEVEAYVQDELGLVDWTCQDAEKLAKVLCDANLGRTAKKKLMQGLLPSKTQQEKEIITLLSSGTAKLSKVFDDEELDKCEKSSLSFQDDNLDELEPILAAALGERYEGLLRLKTIYDWSLLAKILRLDESTKSEGEQHLLSECKVRVYEEHKQDLAVLKAMLKGKPLYNMVFRKEDDASYAAYIRGKKNQEEYCKALGKQLEGVAEYKAKMKALTSFAAAQNDEERLLFRIANGMAFPKQTTKDNGIIPIQVHLAELHCILDRAEKYLPFLRSVDEQGISVREKIEQIVKFRIPYYVGPLAGTKLSREQGRCWVVRSKEKVYPWNFDKVVNLEESAEKFITNMTAKCTYLIGEDVLPKESLLYSEFMVRNALNNLTVDGERLPVLLLQKIYQQLFLNKTSRVTKSSLVKFFKQENVAFEDIGGIDDKINASMKAYNDFRRIFGAEYIEPHREQLENIIRWITLFCDEKKMLETKIRSSYPDIPDDKIKAIKKLKYKDWGRLSKSLLSSSKIAYVDDATGEVVTIISALRNTNKNFMELLSKNCSYGFIDKIEAFNSGRQGRVDKLTYKIVDELYVSPAVKRSIWQTLTILEEIKKIMGHEPKRIFIEMARSKEESKRTDSRLKKLQELYKKCKEETVDFMPKADELKALQTQLNLKKDEDLRSDKLYLYYTQMGRCMYTGERIEISSLFEKEIRNGKLQDVYDIDHIYPRSKTKDDSLSNRVLVKRKVNAAKTDNYPLDAATQKRMHSFWKMLYDKGFIDQKKYERLVRTNPLTDEELAGFISRQLVETRQSTKAVAAILQASYEHSEVVYAKAGNVSDFRQQFNFVKCREVNDLHHAKDAYLNIVVGNCYHVKFTKNPLAFISKNQDNRRYSLKPDVFYRYDIRRGSETAWIGGAEGTLTTVSRVMHKNNILFTRQAVEGKGKLFDQTLQKASDKKYLPLKRNLPVEKYGGYKKLTTAYFVLIKSGNKKITIEGVPSVYAKQGRGGVQQYLEDVLQLTNPKIMINKIRKYSLFKINGFLMHISASEGVSDSRNDFYPACQFYISDEDADYIKKAFKYKKTIKDDEGILANQSCNEEMHVKASRRLKFYDKTWNINRESNLRIYNLFVDRLDNLYKDLRKKEIKKYKEGRDAFINLEINKQIDKLEEILKVFQCASVGEIRLNKNITNLQQCILINQSPTGVFEQEVDLMKL